MRVYEAIKYALRPRSVFGCSAYRIQAHILTYFVLDTYWWRWDRSDFISAYSCRKLTI